MRLSNLVLTRAAFVFALALPQVALPKTTIESARPAPLMTSPAAKATSIAPPPAPKKPGAPNVLGLTAYTGKTAAAEFGTDWIAGVDLVWSDAAPTEEAWSWTSFDTKIQAVDQVGASAIPVFVCRSAWGASPAPSDWVGGGGIQPVTPPIDAETWAAFVTKVVERYDGDGTDDLPGLKHPVRAWKLMPDLVGNWTGDAPHTIDYIKATSAAIRAADPRALIVLGSLTDTDLDLMAVDSGFMTAMILGDKKITRGVIRGVDNLHSRVNFIGDVIIGTKGDFAVFDIHHLTSSSAATERLRFLSEWCMRIEVGRKIIWSLYNAVPSIAHAMPDSESVASECVRTAISAILGGCRRFAWPADADGLPRAAVLAPYPLTNANGHAQPVQAAWAEMAKRLRGLTMMNLWNAPVEAPAARLISIETTSASPFVAAWNEGTSQVSAVFNATQPVEIRNAISGAKRTVTPEDGKVTIELGPIPQYLTGVGKPVNQVAPPAEKKK